MNTIRSFFAFKYIRSKLIVSYSLLVIMIVAAIGTANYKSAKASYEGTIRMDFAQNIINTSHMMDDFNNKMEELTMNIALDSTVLEVLKKENTSKKESLQDNNRIHESLLSIKGSTSSISGITIFSEDGRSFNLGIASTSVGYNFYKKSWYKALTDKNCIFVGIHYPDNLIQVIPYPVISYVKPVIDKESGKSLGYILIDYNYEYFENDIKSQMNIGSDIYIVTDNHELLLATGQDLVKNTANYASLLDILDDVSNPDVYQMNTLPTDNGDYFYSALRSANTSFLVFSLASKEELFKNTCEIRKNIIFAGLFSILLTILVSICIAHNITRPLQELIKEMNIVKVGRFDSQVNIKSKDEIGILADTFNEMIQKIKQMITELIILEHEKKKAEIYALQLQINPHFLHNTLSTIDSLATIKGELEIAEMTRALSKLFRYSIESKEVSTIAQEIDKIRLYLFIEKKRFNERLDFNIQIDDTLMNISILKLLLQPIVENSIIHCLEDSCDKLLIYINISKSSERRAIKIAILDTGKGISPERLVELQNNLSCVLPDFNRKEGSGRLHVGLSNVNSRIRKVYGKEWGLSLTSQLGQGTTVVLMIPIEADENMPTYKMS